jgi:hypothetical protein
MALSVEHSQQVTARLAGKMLASYRDSSRIIICPFNLTQVVAGDVASSRSLAFIPPGMYRFYRHLSAVFFSAFGASRTLDLGWLAYVDKDGTAVATSMNGLNAAIDVSALGTAVIGTALTTGFKDFESRDGVYIAYTVAGGTIPAAATLNGALVLGHN